MRPIGIAGLQLQLGKGDNSDRIVAEVAAVKAFEAALAAAHRS